MGDGWNNEERNFKWREQHEEPLGAQKSSVMIEGNE